MKRFAAVLRQARGKLQIPEPSRSRILLEIASDLEDSFQYHLAQGCDEAEATRRAEEAFAASDEALKHLIRIHQSGWGGVTSRVTRHVGKLWEKILLVAILVFEIWLAGRAVLNERFLAIMSPFVWPIAGLAFAVFVFTVWKLYQILVLPGRDVRRLRTGLGVLPFLAGASLAIGIFGMLYHLRRFANLAVEGAPRSIFQMFAPWTFGISSMMTLGLLTAVLAALVWFVLTNLVTRSELREVESLLEAEA